MKKETKSQLITLICILGIIFGFSIFFNNSSILFEENKTQDLGIKSSDTSLKIVSTISIISDVIQNIIGPGNTLSTIVSGQEDPHSYEPTPAEIIALSTADVVFRMGIEDIEPWWTTTASSINSSGTWKPTIVELKEDDMFKNDPLFFAVGGAINPHIWMDPNNIENFTYRANTTLCSLDPPQSSTFSNNTQTYINVLDDLLSQINNATQKFQDLKVVVYHPAFFYLFNLLNLSRIALIEPGEDKEPSAADIANVIDIMEQSGCRLIIYDPQHKSDSIYEIARTTGSKLALLTPLLNVMVSWNGIIKTISTYKEMIEYNLWALANPVNPPSLENSLWLFIILGV
ncbi:MAG: metal ABC transporter substrate-binding protein, partial [Promethearchaeota archaeon]